MSLQKLYYHLPQPTSFSGVNKLKLKSPGKINIKDWLHKQNVYSLHAPNRKKFPRRATYASKKDAIWQADLVDVPQLKKYNKGYRYILTCIDIFTKWAWAIPLKRKLPKYIITAFKKILKKGRKPEKLQTDKGGEFENKHFQKYLKQENIHFYTSQNDVIKASIVERFNRTMKQKMYKYFTAYHTQNFISILDDLLRSYNNSMHRTIGMTPSEASNLTSSTDMAKLYNKIYSKVDTLKYTKKLFKLGDLVRISKYKNVFEKGYTPNYTTEVFKVRKVYTGKPNLYGLEDKDGVLIEGRFYAEEMQLYTGKTFKKLLRKRTIKGVKYFLVDYIWHDPEWVRSTEYYKIRHANTFNK